MRGAGGDSTAGGFGFLRLRDLQELSFRAERGICCARQRQRARFLVALGMTSSKRLRSFVSEIVLVLEIGWDDQAF
jgi:hypothetical protein